MAASAVVEDLEVLEQRVGQFDAGAPAPPVEQFSLDAPPEGLDDGCRNSLRSSPIEGSSPDSFARRVNAQEVNCTPWSE